MGIMNIFFSSSPPEPLDGFICGKKPQEAFFQHTYELALDHRGRKYSVFVGVFKRGNETSKSVMTCNWPGQHGFFWVMDDDHNLHAQALAWGEKIPGRYPQPIKSDAPLCPAVHPIVRC